MELKTEKTSTLIRINLETHTKLNAIKAVKCKNFDEAINLMIDDFLKKNENSKIKNVVNNAVELRFAYGAA